VRILVAGIGNVFLGDDGFGPAVASALGEQSWPAHVEVADFGVRGFDLAFALTSGLDAAVLVDAVARGGAPGTLYNVEPDTCGGAARSAGAGSFDAHAMDPVRVLALAASLGELPRLVRVVGCEPARLGEEDGDISVGLSEQVAGAIAPAVAMIAELVAELEARCTS
jgi:hydrogenase maturation protease